MARQLAAKGEILLNYIYFCWGSAHSSVTAAAVHLRQLRVDRRPTVAQVMLLPRFDLTANSEVGQLFFMGNDDNGDAVFVLGLGSEHRAFRHVIDSYLQLIGLQPTDYRLANCLPCVDWFTRIGGFSSRSLGLIWFGRRLAAFGVSRCFPNYQQLVQRVRAASRQEPRFLDWSPTV